MTLALTKPAGWAFGEIFTSAQAEDLDAKTAAALDGVNGGTYSLASPLILGGARLEVTGELRVTGLLTITGNTTIGNSDVDTLTVVSTPTFQALTTFANGIVVSSDGAEIHGSSSFGSNLSVGSDLTVGGELDVSGAVTIHDNLNVTTGNTFFCNAFLQVDGEAETNARLDIRAEAHVWDLLTVHSGGSLNVNGPSDFSGNVTLRSVLGFAGSGRVPMRHSTTLGNADKTISVADGNLFRIPDNNTAARNYTLSNDGAQAGDYMIFYQDDGTNLAHDVRLRNGAGSQISQTNAGAAGAFLFCVHNGSSWMVALSAP